MRFPVLSLCVAWLLVAPACSQERDCGDQTVEVTGSPSLFTITPGAQPEGYDVAEPLLCPDGTTTIAVSAAGARELRDAEADTFFAELAATLAAQGVTAYGPGMTAFECTDTSRPSPYLYFLQVGDWAWADVTVAELGAGLAQAGFGATVAVYVGIPIACAV